VSGRVEVDELGIQFTFDRQRRPVLPGVARLRPGCSTQWGIRRVTLRIEPGEGVALIGPNGAGKTTLLRALGGVYEPDEGRVSVWGRVGSLLAVGAGLVPLLTGRDNCLLVGALTGRTRAESRRALEVIKHRSRLEDAFEQEVSTYSQGMRARLAFAALAQAEPDVLLLDEVHQAFDLEFREVVVERAAALRDTGGVVLAAGHDLAGLADLCSRGVWLDEGAVVRDGDFAEVAEEYAERAVARERV
jgi:ABC-type polysaccharide/polyol phosphate transport system ATPase subunit